MKCHLQTSTVIERNQDTVIRQETLDKYVRRILKEKGLSLSDVERRSGGGISDSYICGIINGTVGSLTIIKLKALAQGLGIGEDELFAVARGVTPADDNEFQESEFATLFCKYKDLSDEDKKVVLTLLEVVDREIEWRRMGSKFKTRQHSEDARETRSQSIIMAETEMKPELRTDG